MIFHLSNILAGEEVLGLNIYQDLVLNTPEHRIEGHRFS
jgi:hypothetical protein